MISCKLILKNVRKNMQDYCIYFLTLALAVSLFYAFNSLSDQPAFTEMSMTRALLYDQLDQLLGVLSVALAFVLGFLILYANQFLLRRRKKRCKSVAPPAAATSAIANAPPAGNEKRSRQKPKSRRERKANTVSAHRGKFFILTSRRKDFMYFFPDFWQFKRCKRIKLMLY